VSGEPGNWADYYSLLGVTQDATADEIRRAYRQAAKAHHPDHGGDGDHFGQVREAFEVLSDQVRRAAYDEAHEDGGSWEDPSHYGGEDLDDPTPPRAEDRTRLRQAADLHLRGPAQVRA
jgi:curved DNA-binding protein CbpA